MLICSFELIAFAIRYPLLATQARLLGMDDAVAGGTDHHQVGMPRLAIGLKLLDRHLVVGLDTSFAVCP